MPQSISRGSVSLMKVPQSVTDRAVSDSLAMDFVFDGAVVPHTGHWLAVDQRLSAVQALPVSDPGDRVSLTVLERT